MEKIAVKIYHFTLSGIGLIVDQLKQAQYLIDY